MSQPFIEIIKASMATYAGRIAFVDEYGARRLTFDHVRIAWEQTGQWIDSNTSRGGRVCTVANNSVESVLVEWAANHTGRIWVGVTPSMGSPAALVQATIMARPELIIIDNRALGPSYDLWPGWSELKPPSIENVFEGFRVLKAPSATAPIHGLRECTTRIRFTSGTSGKGVKAIVYTKATQDAIFKNLTCYLKLAASVSEAPNVMLHAHPIVWATGSLIGPIFAAGGVNVLLPEFKIQRFADAALNEKCTRTFLVPRTLSHVLAFCTQSRAANFGYLRQAIIAGAALPVHTLSRARAILPQLRISYTLGMTEASFPITSYEIPGAADCVIDPNNPLVPLGRIQPGYSSETYVQERRLKISGPALATQRLLEGGIVEDIVPPFDSGDTVDQDERGCLHYRCSEGVMPVPRVPYEAIEGVIEECSGVARARVRSIEGDEFIKLQVQPGPSEISKDAIAAHFEKEKDNARIVGVRLRPGDIEFGDVRVTPSAKVIRGE